MTRRGLVLVALLVPVALPSCGKKEPPAPESRTQEAPATVTTTTTLPPPTTAPTPPPVWRTTHWGMKRAELLAALPGEAQRLAQPAAFAQPQSGSSLPAGSTDLGIPSYEMDGTKFRVLFGFASDALDRVHLEALKAGSMTCLDLEKALTASHAEPSQRGATGGSLRGEEIVWKRPDQTITLGCSGQRSLGFHRVTLDYTPPAG